MRYLLFIQVLLLLVACGTVDRMGDKYYYKPTDKAAAWVEERKAEDEEYRKQRPEVIAQAAQEGQDETDEEIQEALDKQVQMYCLQIPELRRRLPYCDEILGTGDSTRGPNEAGPATSI